LSAAEHFLKIELTKNFRVIRDLELMPEFGGQNWTAVFLQKFEGSVTILPKSRAWDWLRLLSDPDEKELARMMDVGMRATWPKIHMISNRLKIESQIEVGRENVRKAMRLTTTVSHNTLLADADTSAIESGSDFDLGEHLRKAAIDEAKEIAGLGRTSTEESAASTTAKSRRKEIIRRLGLNRYKNSDKSINRKASNQSSTRPYNEGVSAMRRRVSIGQIQLALRVKRSSSEPGGESSDDDGDFEEGDYSSGERF